MLIVWVNVDLYMAFKQILFSIGFLNYHLSYFFLNLGDKKNQFLFCIFLIFKKVLLVPSAQWTLWIGFDGPDWFRLP